MWVIFVSRRKEQEQNPTNKVENELGSLGFEVIYFTYLTGYQNSNSRGITEINIEMFLKTNFEFLAKFKKV